jgi:hypothetical protein
MITFRAFSWAFAPSLSSKKIQGNFQGKFRDCGKSGSLISMADILHVENGHSKEKN